LLEIFIPDAYNGTKTGAENRRQKMESCVMGIMVTRQNISETGGCGRRFVATNWDEKMLEERMR